mgnify:CR=1 FL=1
METTAEKKQALEDLTPREIVNKLDTYIVGQQKAKKSVAIALRNRTRRLKLPEDIRDEIAPKNILMIGPTGVGKTEIARRLAKLCGAPFLKVEATKYTEVGYVGRDVESMVRDLMAVGYKMVKSEMQEDLRVKAEEKVEDALLDLLLPGSGKDTKKKKTFFGMGQAPVQNPENLPAENEADKGNMAETREKFRTMLREGKLEDRTVEVVASRGNKMPTFEIFAGGNMEDMERDANRKLQAIKENLERLYNELLNKDWFMTLLDLEDYIKVKDQMFEDYKDREKWQKMMLVNIAKAGFFSSDRTIADYNRDVWKL